MTPRLFLRVAGTEARKRLVYRADFWLQAIAVFAIEFGMACEFLFVVGIKRVGQSLRKLKSVRAEVPFVHQVLGKARPVPSLIEALDKADEELYLPPLPTRGAAHQEPHVEEAFRDLVANRGLAEDFDLFHEAGLFQAIELS